MVAGLGPQLKRKPLGANTRLLPLPTLRNRDLLKAHVEALFTLDAAGRLLRVNEPDGKPAPRFFLGKTRDANDWWVRNDLSEHTVRGIRETCASLPVGMEVHAPGAEPAPVEAILNATAPIERIWSGPAFRFPEAPAASSAVLITGDNAEVLKPLMPDWVADVTASAPLFAMLVDGQAVSVCGSVRRTPVAHEAGAETVPAFRGRGFGAEVVRAWAWAVMRLDRLPLFSTAWTNEASRALARRLGLVQFASDLHLT